MKLVLKISDETLVDLIRRRWALQDARRVPCTASASYMANDGLPTGWHNLSHACHLEIGDSTRIQIAFEQYVPDDDTADGPIEYYHATLTTPAEWYLLYVGRRCSLFLCETPLGLLLPWDSQVLAFESCEPNRPWYVYEHEYYAMEDLRGRLIADLRENHPDVDLNRWPWIFGQTEYVH